MKDRATEKNGGASDPQSSELAGLTLEDRVRRLEDAVADLQDTGPVEDRIVERVADRLSRTSPSAIQESTSAILDAGRHLLPAAVRTLQGQVNPSEPQARPRGLRRPWLFFDAFVEARSMLRMYFDPRHRLSWEAVAVPVAVLFLMLLSWLWLGGLLSPFGPILDKIVDIILIFFAYKALSREARRYQETIPDPTALPR